MSVLILIVFWVVLGLCLAWRFKYCLMVLGGYALIRAALALGLSIPFAGMGVRMVIAMSLYMWPVVLVALGIGAALGLRLKRLGATAQ
ncbi:hypothetical protein [Celeribacter marinus]|uniref:hypothetical protein n=1 Tax=Celeribacter marinus TaxID=1397108 RepID=UPI003F6D9681